MRARVIVIAAAMAVAALMAPAAASAAPVGGQVITQSDPWRCIYWPWTCYQP